MADISSQLLLFQDGKLQKIGGGDTIEQSRINGLTSALSTLTSDVSAAQTDATQALSDAAAAQSTANSAASAASDAQVDATQALADAAGAQGTANSAVTAAAAAQTDATQALADAAGAQSTANSAVSAAAAAQTDATQALADAAAAQSTANGAVTDAAAAQSTANSALSAANNAQSSANAAQADATQALSDAAAAQSDATSALGAAAAAQATANAALPASGTQTFDGDLTITGDLTVQGEVYSKVPTTVLVGDSFLDLNSGNTASASATAGGFTVNVKASGSALTATAFVAGVASTSNPYLSTSGSSLVAGDIVQVSGSVDSKNDGLYVVSSGGSSSQVYVKGIGTVATDLSKTPFAKNQFVAQTSQNATVTKVDLAVFAASNGLIEDSSGPIAAGTFCYKYAAAATESAFSNWTPISSVAVPTLEQVLASGSMLGDVDKIGYSLTVAASTDAGSLVYIDSSGVCQKLSSAISGGELEGVTLEATSGSNAAKKVATLLGQKLLVKAKSGDEPSAGDLVYVSDTAGSVGKTVPSSGRVIKVGRCVGAVSGGLYPVIYLPQYIADL